jgi:hypothetical protein
MVTVRSGIPRPCPSKTAAGPGGVEAAGAGRVEAPVADLAVVADVAALDRVLPAGGPVGPAGRGERRSALDRVEFIARIAHLESVLFDESGAVRSGLSPHRRQALADASTVLRRRLGWAGLDLDGDDRRTSPQPAVTR